VNILFLSTRLTYPPFGGHFQRTFNIVKHLSKTHNVFYVSFYKKNLSDTQKYEYRSEMAKYCKECYSFDIPLEKSKICLILTVVRSIFSQKPFIAFKYKTVEMEQCITDILKNNTIDYVHYDMLPLAEYIPITTGIKNVLTEHNIEYYRYMRWIPYERNIPKKLYIMHQYKNLKKYEEETVDKFGKCIVMSEYDKKILAATAQSTSFYVIPNGTDTQYFKPLPEHEESDTVVWAGGMSMWPNRDAVTYFMDEIFPLILKEKPGVKFHVIGNEPPRILFDSKYKSNVIAYGFVEDIRPIIAKAAVYVAPIRIGSGTKLKILDAMAMGKAIVTTSVGAEGIEVQNNRELSICDTPNDFATRVLMLLGNQSLAREFSRKARKTAEDVYEWDKILMRLDKVYE
jgi:glycosyltransferase involved in cell wall biosynthesis